MHNSFSLGLFHGTLYGITPITPWFFGLYQFVFYGQNKGLLTFAGLYLGQVVLLLAAFFGGTQLLWVWYYLEPVFIAYGFLLMLFNYIFILSDGGVKMRLLTGPANRKEALFYFGTGILLALGNPGGAKGGGLLLNTFPENPAVYLCGFLLVYTTFAVGVVYALCLSPLGQKYFGPWSLKDMLNNNDPRGRVNTGWGGMARGISRVGYIRIATVASFLVVLLQFFQLSPRPFSAFYLDFLFGGTPAKSLTPMREFAWVESEEIDKTAEDTNEEEPPKVWKRQSQLDMNHIMDNEADPNIEEEAPWHTVWKYNQLNEKLEREGISDEQKELEVEHLEAESPNTEYVTRYVKWYMDSKLRLQLQPDWASTEMNAHWLKELTRIRAEMDDIFVAQHEASFNTARPHLPFTPSFDIDYDWDPVAVAKNEELTEDEALELRALQFTPKAKNFMTETYDMVHRGGEYVDVGAVTLQDLPKEVHFPWDYPLVRAPNVPDIRPGIEEEERTVVETKNAVQNKNVWFLDPIAVNMRFLANDPAPATDSRWTAGPIIKGEPTPADIPEFRAPNTTRRWWRGPDANVEADTQVVTQTPREIISAKVIPGGTKRP